MPTDKPARTRLAWQMTPDLWFPRREATRADLLGHWIRCFQSVSPPPPRLLTVLAIVNRYRRHVAAGLKEIQECGRLWQESTGENGARAAVPVRAPRRRWPFGRRAPAPAVDLAQDLQRARAATAALERVLAIWMDLAVQHDEVALLMDLLDQDLEVVLAQPAKEPAAVPESFAMHRGAA